VWGLPFGTSSRTLFTGIAAAIRDNFSPFPFTTATYADLSELSSSRLFVSFFRYYLSAPTPRVVLPTFFSRLFPLRMRPGPCRLRFFSRIKILTPSKTKTNPPLLVYAPGESLWPGSLSPSFQNQHSSHAVPSISRQLPSPSPDGKPFQSQFRSSNTNCLRTVGHTVSESPFRSPPSTRLSTVYRSSRSSPPFPISFLPNPAPAPPRIVPPL